MKSPKPKRRRGVLYDRNDRLENSGTLWIFVDLRIWVLLENLSRGLIITLMER